MKPSDFSPPNALEMQAPDIDSRNMNRDVWTMRVIGAALLLAGWALSTLHEFPTTHFFLNTAILCVLGVYAFVAAARTRGLAVNLERKLRHGLLVHNMELANMAMQDDLTQLFNRRYFFDRLERELQTATGFERPLSVIVIDLDSMKSVNDTCGHRVGDQLLASFGGFLVRQTRASDVAARIGGDEFALLLPDTAQQAATVLMERIAQRLEGTALIEDASVSLRISASFGMSGYPWGGFSVDAIMLQADAAMYANKHLRKNGASANGAVAAASGAPEQPESR